MKPFIPKKPKEVKRRECKLCNKRFEITRYWKIFCSPDCRSIHHNTNRHLCFYCDGIATESDHVWPTAARKELRPRAIQSYGPRVRQTGGGKTVAQETVPCCTECNHILRGTADATFDDRITRLLMAFAMKHDLLSSPIEWEPNELVELGPNLRQHVKAGLAKRRQSERRLVYMVGVRAWWRRGHNGASIQPPINQLETT